MKNKDINGIFHFYDENNIGSEDKHKFMKLFVGLGAISSYGEHRFVPTGKVRIKITAADISQNFSQTLQHTDIIDSENVSIYSLSKFAISKLEEQNLDSNNFTLQATIDTEFEVYGYAGDLNRKYPWNEYRNINKDLPLHNKNGIEIVDQKYKEFLEYKEFFEYKKEFVKKNLAIRKQDIINKKCFCTYSKENESKLLELGFGYWVGRGKLEKISADNIAEVFILEDNEIKTSIRKAALNFTEIKLINNEFYFC